MTRRKKPLWKVKLPRTTKRRKKPFLRLLGEACCQQIGLLRWIRNKIPKEKLTIIAEAIFSTKIRYGIFIYLTPVFED